MPTPADTWSLRKLASVAGVLPKIARDAAAEGVIDEKYAVETDVLLVRVYAALKRLVWPKEHRPANKDQGLRLWEAITIDTIRAALPDDLTAEHGLFVHDAGCSLVVGPGAYCQTLFDLQDRPFYYLPIGRWFDELPSRAALSALEGDELVA